MNLDDLRQHYGPEFPEAVELDGVRMPLAAERRFTRIYRSPETSVVLHHSRIMDGSTVVTLSDVEASWLSWSEQDRIDFSLGACWLKSPDDLPIIRFILANGSPREVSSIATCATTRLPRDEAYAYFAQRLLDTPVGHAANLVQAVSITKHPKAVETIRERLTLVWQHPTLWEPDSFTNWVAFEATVCIEHLLALGADPLVLEPEVKALSQHPCEGNRDTCGNYLGQYYSWLPQPNPHIAGA